MIRKNPKILLGYSDITALLLSVHAKTGLITFHGPNGMGRWDAWSLEYLKRETLVTMALRAFTVTNTTGKYDLDATCMGGGLSGQAGALRLAIGRALARGDESLRGVLGREGLLTRDPRMKERKKYGQPGARKRFQFSKR